jgi:hypothetical protein
MTYNGIKVILHIRDRVSNMPKIKQTILSLLLLGAFAFMFFRWVNYDPFEFRLVAKTMLKQPLTLMEMKNSMLYKAYEKIDYDTEPAEVSRILNKRDKDVMNVMKAWYYPHGYVSVWYNDDKKPRIAHKSVGFSRPYTVMLEEQELNALLECNTIDEICGILGEPGILSVGFDESGRINHKSFKWGIKTDVPYTIIENIEKKYGEYVDFPYSYTSPVNFLRSINFKRKFCLQVSIDADNRIEHFWFEKYGR